MYCQPQVHKTGGEGAVGWIKSIQNLSDRLIASEGLRGLYEMPFFKEMDVDEWHKKVKTKNFPLKKINGVDKRKTSKWREWALSSIDQKTNPVSAQLIYKEFYDLHNGVRQSPSIDEYDELLKDKTEITTKTKNQFLTAIQFGFDLFLPTANGSLQKDDTLNKEVTSGSDLSKVAPGQAADLLTKEEKEYEEAVGIDIKRTGKYGPKKSMKYLGLGAALIGVAIGMSSKASGTMDKWISKPINRGLLFQTVAILAIVNHSIVKKNLEKVESNRAYVKGILDRFEVQESNSIEGEDVPISLAQQDTRSIPANSKNVVLPRNTLAASNYEQKELKKLIKDLGVPCANGRLPNGDCVPVDISKGAKEVASSIGSAAALELLKPLSSISKVYNDASKGKFESAVRTLEGLGNKKNVKGLETALQKIQKEVNKVQFENGGKIVDFKKQTQNLAGEFRNPVIDAIRRTPGGFNSFQSFLGVGRSSSGLNSSLSNSLSQTKENNEAKNKKKEEKPETKPIAFAEPVKFDSNIKPFNKKFNLRKRKKIKKKLTPERAFAGNVLEHHDVVKKKEESIFRILSHRYLKTALPKLFKKKKPLKK